MNYNYRIKATRGPRHALDTWLANSGRDVREEVGGNPGFISSQDPLHPIKLSYHMVRGSGNPPEGLWRPRAVGMLQGVADDFAALGIPCTLHNERNEPPYLSIPTEHLEDRLKWPIPEYVDEADQPEDPTPPYDPILDLLRAFDRLIAECEAGYRKHPVKDVTVTQAWSRTYLRWLSIRSELGL